MAQTIKVRSTSRAHRSHRGGHSSITRNYNNLIMIRIQRTKSVKNKQVVPNSLSLAHVIHKNNSDIVMVSETWLSEDIPGEALCFPGIPGLNVTRNDRVNKRGGGVAIFLRTQFRSKYVLNSLL